jgi:hypothetical protein
MVPSSISWPEKTLQLISLSHEDKKVYEIDKRSKKSFIRFLTGSNDPERDQGQKLRPDHRRR